MVPLPIDVVTGRLWKRLPLYDAPAIFRAFRESTRCFGSGQAVFVCVTDGFAISTSPETFGAATVPPSENVPAMGPEIEGVGPAAAATSRLTSLPSMVTRPRIGASETALAPLSATTPSAKIGRASCRESG